MKLIIDIPEEVYNYIMRLQLCNMAEEYIKNGIPLDEQEPKWIPVSERLPEKGSRVLVTTFGVVAEAWRDSEITDKLKWVMIDPINHRVTPNVNSYTYGIKYWMPLPEPYKAESEAKNEKR